MSLGAERLYALLPAVYRTRDAQAGGPLAALFAVIAGQAGIVEDNIAQLYDDHFIETCLPWVVPYIGDLVGWTPLHEFGGVPAGRRAEVANTIGYRRRKGTLLALEQVAMDASARPAAAVEFFKRVLTTQSLRHVRPRHAATPDLRRGRRLERLGTAFDSVNRTVDVRRIAPPAPPAVDPDPRALDIHLRGGGRYNIPDVGVYLWRWKSLPVTGAPAFRVDGRRYVVSPLGHDMPLFNQVAPRESFSRLTARMDVPQPILRREFHHDLEAFYGAGRSVELLADGVPIPASRICCRNLADRRTGGWAGVPSGKVAIDPVLGRIQFAADTAPPRDLRVTYCYGFPAEIGGGPYDRSAQLAVPDDTQLTLTAVVGTNAAPALEDAVAAWNRLPAGSTGLIVLPGFEAHDVDLTGGSGIEVPAGSRLWIAAAQVHAAGGAPTYDDSRAVLRGDIEIRGVPPAGSASNGGSPAGQVILSGLWISGTVSVDGAPSVVQFADCTLVPGIALTRDGKPQQPGEPSLVVTAAGADIALMRCVSGPVAAAVGGITRICASVVDSTSVCGVAYAGRDLASEGADLHVEDSTIVGKLRVHTMALASNTIFLARRPRHDPWAAALWCGRRQAGCMRFCFVPSDAITPRRFRCLPDDAAGESALWPAFVTLRYGHPSYALLSGDVPMALWTGGDDGGQIGVYHVLSETEAARNVQLRAAEYLPFGLEAGIVLEPSRPVVLRPTRYAYAYGARPAPDPCSEDEEDLLFAGIGANLL